MNTRNTVPSLMESSLPIKMLSVLIWTHLVQHTQQAGMEGYKVFKIFAETENDVKAIRHVKDTYKLDPWREVRTPNSSGDYLVPPNHLNDVMDAIGQRGLRHEEVIADVPGFLKNQTSLRHRTRRRRDTNLITNTTDPFRYRYLPYDEIMKFLKYIQDNARRVHIHLDSIGRSFEERDTPYIKISRDPNEKKPILFIDAGIHGREWISPAMAVEIIHRLALNREQDPIVDRLVDRFDWLIVPLVNPDGYEYTFTPEVGSRMWRKSRSSLYHHDPSCYGVDLNRNYAYAWNDNPVFGGNNDPCSGTFSGPYSFSEPETQNIRSLLLGNRDSILAYISLHSFGQFFLYPWGFSSEVDLEDEKELHHVASAFADTMRTKNYRYNVGGSAKTLYPAAGGSDDYVRGTVGVKYAYIVELPPHDTSPYGFMLPEEDVKEIVTDTWAGLRAFYARLHHMTSEYNNSSKYHSSRSTP